jgi:quercetin dioxygenase-like cupin family protein
MQKIIRNKWYREPGANFEKAQILNHEIHPEGLDVDRIKFSDAGCIKPSSSVGHLISVLSGTGKLIVEGNNKKPFELEEGVHIYLPPGTESDIEGISGAEMLRVASPSASQAPGKKILIRNETFLSACASRSQSFRWVLTPQYLSRRIFLYHDQVLLSKSGNPVSWFRTTMFDVAGLPKNEDGDSVFKMSYNSRTEFNVCYDVKGSARVRMAKHPYTEKKQIWHPWSNLDSETTYHLNEVASGPDEETVIDRYTGMKQFRRNKHEVHMADGHVSLFCLFDPSPTGVEKHRAGEYSDYEPLSLVIGSKAYEIQQQEMARYDEMVDRLSLAKAMGELNTLYGTPIWQEYLQGREAQYSIELELKRALTDEGNGRERVIAQWMQRKIDNGA